jgi:glycosyltransferase involved in cell wall biosynthesis
MFDNEFPPLGGGTGVVNLHLFEGLAEYPDVRVDLVTSSRSRSTYETEQFSERITIHKVPVHNRNIHHATGLELLRYASRGWAYARRLVRAAPYDLSFAFAGVPAGAISFALHRTHGLPYIISLQGPDVPGFEARYRFLYPFLKPVLRRIWSSASAVLAISQDHCRLAQEFMPLQSVEVLHNGVDTESFRPPARVPPAPPVVILCAGRLIKRKGQHHLLRAVSALPAQVRAGCRLRLVGTGDSEEDLRVLASRLGISDRVEFAGYVPRERMPEEYRRAHLFVLPSQTEGMSMALLEAMATGLPVVVTDTGGSAELVRDGVTGYIVRWGDVAGLTRRLTSLLENPSLRVAFGEAARAIAQKFGWKAIVARYVELWATCSMGKRVVPLSRQGTPG